MENLKTVSALVKNILEHDHKARNTDNHLYLMVLEHYSGLRGIDIHAMTVPVFLKELDRRSFPGFETVRRSRQKVQATYPDLAPSEAVGKRRAKNEVVFLLLRQNQKLKEGWRLSAKLDRIGADLEKARKKRAEWDAKVNDLERRYREEENSEIHEMVHAANLNPEQLSELLRMFAADMAPKPDTINTMNEEETQNEI